MKVGAYYSSLCAAAILLASADPSPAQTNAATSPNAVIPIVANNSTNAVVSLPTNSISIQTSTNTVGLQPANQKDEARASDLLRAYSGDLVFVSGKSGAASGFVAQYKNRKFFITNAHVLAGLGYLSLETLDRSPLQVKSDSGMTAVGHDLIAIPVTQGADGIPAMDKVDSEIVVGDSIVVFGNSLAGGVVNPLLGKVVGLGPRIIEVTGQFEPGSSGGPVIHLRTGKVICVATYVTRSAKISGEEATRRFGYRLDTVTGWQHIDYRRFQYESDVLNAVHRITRQLDDAAEDVIMHPPQNSAQLVDVGGRKVLIQGSEVIVRHEYESPLIREAVSNYEGANAANRDEATTILLSTLNGASEINLNAAAPLFTYDFFKHGDAEIPGWSREEANGFENEKQARAEILRELTSHLQQK